MTPSSRTVPDPAAHICLDWSVSFFSVRFRSVELFSKWPTTRCPSGRGRDFTCFIMHGQNGPNFPVQIVLFPPDRPTPEPCNCLFFGPGRELSLPKEGEDNDWCRKVHFFLLRGSSPPKFLLNCPPDWVRNPASPGRWSRWRWNDGEQSGKRLSWNIYRITFAVQGGNERFTRLLIK